MSRPVDWSALDRHDDPVPGDWSQVSRDAAAYGRVADAIDQARKDLIRVFQEGQLTGDAIDAMKEVALEVADRIGRAKARYRGVADALAVYATPLRDAQDESVAILARANASRDERDHARERADYWQNEWMSRRYAGDPQADIDEAERHWHYWQGELQQFGHEIHAAIAALGEVIARRDAAANTAAAAIGDVENSGDINDDFWDDVDQFLTDNPWIQDVVNVASIVAAVLAVVALFVPGLNLLVLVVSIVVAAAVIANAWAKAGTGRISLVEAIVTTVLAVVPFGVGKVLSGFSAAARTGMTSTAATSVMRSAAGSGLSGITRPVATMHVVDLIRPQTGVLAGSSFSELLQLGALAKTPLLLSGNTSTAVARSYVPVVSWFAAEVAYAGSDPVVSLGIDALDPYRDLPKNSWQNSTW